MSNEGENKQCDECGAFRGQHSVQCSMATIDQLRQALNIANNKADWSQSYNYKHHEQALLWKGKWQIVKEENNVLRKKIASLIKSNPPTP
jgi:hypothetical protein